MKRITLTYSYTVYCSRVFDVSDEFAVRVEREDLFSDLAYNGGFDIPNASTVTEQHYDHPEFEVDSRGPDGLVVEVTDV